MDTARYVKSSVQKHKVISLYPVKKGLNPSPSSEILDLSRLNAFADDKINVTRTLKFGSVRVENIVGKGENAGYSMCYLYLSNAIVGNSQVPKIDPAQSREKPYAYTGLQLIHRRLGLQLMRSLHLVC